MKDNPDKIDVWTIIDTYFRDTTYYKSQHQLDSYNEFIYSETNGIQHIIKRNNPLRIYKESLNAEATEFKYEIEIYFGESLDENGQIDVTARENIYVSSPTEYTNETPKYMFPNIARLKGYTYQSNIFCNIGIIYKNNESGTKKIVNFSKINIGSIPIMVHSKPCLLNGLENQKLTELGECPYDPGGYFIIKGNEKVILSQEKKVDNILYINDSPEDSIILQCLLKSISTEGFQSSRTNAISYIRTNIAKEMEKPSYKNHIVVRILGIGIGDNSKFKIPLFILFRALGIQNDKDILNMIIYENDSDNLKNKLLDLFIYI
jgi:DNA-directed RNA polymerase II subunit RPB2